MVDPTSESGSSRTVPLSHKSPFSSNGILHPSGIFKRHAGTLPPPPLLSRTFPIRRWHTHTQKKSKENLQLFARVVCLCDCGNARVGFLAVSVPVAQEKEKKKKKKKKKDSATRQPARGVRGVPNVMSCSQDPSRTKTSFLRLTSRIQTACFFSTKYQLRA